MTNRELIEALAAALRDALNAMPEPLDDAHPEQVFLSIAQRLVVRLAPVASVVPRDEVVIDDITDSFARVQAVSRDLIRVLSLYRRAGYDNNTLETALFDVAVRLKRATVKAQHKKASTGRLLRELAETAMEMARNEDAELTEIH